MIYNNKIKEIFRQTVLLTQRHFILPLKDTVKRKLKYFIKCHSEIS